MVCKNEMVVCIISTIPLDIIYQKITCIQTADDKKEAIVKYWIYGSYTPSTCILTHLKMSSN